MKEKILFCNITGMKNYRGITKDDKPSGWGGYWVAESGFGHEIFNFEPREGIVYGYVKPGRGEHINILRLGAGENDEKIEGVIVIWVSTNSKLGAVIVGWYKNATIYKDWQKSPSNAKRIDKNGEEIMHNIKTSEKDALLLDEDQRTFEVPRGKQGFGQANVWYAGDNPEYVKKVLDYINFGRREDINNLSAEKAKGILQVDSEKRKRIENSAVDFVIKNYEKNGFIINSVEQDKVGYDLEASKGNLTLRIEVKGREGEEIIADLTPNEYRAMKEYYKDYRICIVTNALKKPDLTVFSFEQDIWTDESGNKLIIEETTGARLSKN
jgi:hypothetical protein